MTASAAARFGLRKIGGIAFNMEDHAASVVVAEDGIWMGGGVVEELGECLGSGFSALGLGRSEGTEGDKHRGVDCSGIVEKCADDLLDPSDVFFCEGWGGVGETPS